MRVLVAGLVVAAMLAVPAVGSAPSVDGRVAVLEREVAGLRAQVADDRAQVLWDAKLYVQLRHDLGLQENYVDGYVAHYLDCLKATVNGMLGAPESTASCDYLNGWHQPQ